MEPEEISEFSKQMKEAGEAGESLMHISLAISILAVLVALVTVLGHRQHTEAVLAQARAGDTWNQYQAKKIRADQVSVAEDLLSLQPSANSAAVEKKLEEYRQHQEHWKDDLAEEQKKAAEYEHEVDRAEKLASHFDLGEALLQIAVVLCSITLFTRNKKYFYLGVAIGGAGVLVAVAAVFV
jgi:lipopolysaccharide export LptBFGC system permease protein LptF